MADALSRSDADKPTNFEAQHFLDILNRLSLRHGLVSGDYERPFVPQVSHIEGSERWSSLNHHKVAAQTFDLGDKHVPDLHHNGLFVL